MRSGLRVTALAAVLLMLTACGKGGPDADDAAKKSEANAEGEALTLTAAQADAMGLVTVKLEAASFRTQLAGYGTVLAFDTLAQLHADIATADATVAQSAAAAARAKDLATGDDAAVSRETAEAAAAKAATDQAAAQLARRKLDAAFGNGAPWRNNAAQLDATLTRLQSGRSVLVKVTFPIGAVAGSQPFTVARVGDNSKNWVTGAAWPAPADAAIPGRSLFALVDGSDLTAAERVIATVGVGAPQPGVLVPATALVLGESDAWIYVKKDNHYERTRIDTSHAAGDNYFVASGLEAGAEVVTSGAGQLYAREINPSSKSDD